MKRSPTIYLEALKTLHDYEELNPNHRGHYTCNMIDMAALDFGDRLGLGQFAPERIAYGELFEVDNRRHVGQPKTNDDALHDHDDEPHSLCYRGQVRLTMLAFAYTLAMAGDL